ncbi:MAG: hypothetical protein F6K35_16525 [Okeania sp. SIO2H7]|nr:hypothetical protein [Okeania sp. SIO2H7]
MKQTKKREALRGTKQSAFWEWGIGNREWVHSIFLQRFDTPNKTDVLPNRKTLKEKL